MTPFARKDSLGLESCPLKDMDKKGRFPIQGREQEGAVPYTGTWTGRGGSLLRDVDRKVLFSEDDSRVTRVKMTHAE